jgi:hypothetical protein
MGVVTTTGVNCVTTAGTRATADVTMNTLGPSSTAASSMKAASRAQSADATNTVVPDCCHIGMTGTALASAVIRSPLPSGARPSSIVLIGFMSMLSIRASS